MSKEETENAILITGSEYLSLKDPEFMGQTRVNESGKYRMYWKSEGKIYYTINSLLTK